MFMLNKDWNRNAPAQRMMKHKTESHVRRTGIAAVFQASNGDYKRTTEDANQDTNQTVFLLAEPTVTGGRGSALTYEHHETQDFIRYRSKATQKRLSTSTRFPPVLTSKLTTPTHEEDIARNRLSGKVQWCKCHWTVHIPGGAGRFWRQSRAAKDLVATGLVWISIS